MTTTKYLTKIEQIPEFGNEERVALKKVAEKFAFRTNEYYMSLIGWDDPNDPIRRIVIPDVEELDDWGSMDASNERTYTVAHGLSTSMDLPQYFW